MKTPDFTMTAPLERSTITITMQRGRWYRIRKRLGLLLFWIALRVLGAHLEMEWEEKDD